MIVETDAGSRGTDILINRKIVDVVRRTIIAVDVDVARVGDVRVVVVFAQDAVDVRR